MSIQVENIEYEEGDFARLLQWQDDVDSVSVIRDGSARPLQGSGSLWHLHEEMELTLVTSGEGTRLVGDRVHPFTAPCMVLLGPRLPHYWHFVTRSSGLCIQWNVARLNNLLPVGHRNEAVCLARQAARGLLLDGPSTQRFRAAVERLLDSQGISRVGTMLQLFGDLARSVGVAAQEISSERFELNALAPGYEKVQQAMMLVMTRFSEDLTLADALEIAGMSKAHFSRQFQTYTGRSFTQFLNEVRIDHACQKLQRHERSISDIAFESGYQNLSHFNRMFRRHRNCSPSEYRKAFWDSRQTT